MLDYAQTLLDNEEKQLTGCDSDAPLNAKETGHNTQGEQTGNNERKSQQWELLEENSGHEELPSMDDAQSRTRTLSLRSAMSISVASTRSAKDFAMNTLSSTKSGKSLLSIANSLKRAGSKSSKMSISTTGSSHSNSTKSLDRMSAYTSSTSEIIANPMSHLFPAVPTDKPLPSAAKEANGKEAPEDLAQASMSKDELNRPIAEGRVDASTLPSQEQSTIRLVTPATRRLLRKSSVLNSFPTPQLKPYTLASSVSDIPTEADGEAGVGLAFLTMDRRSFTETVKSRTADDSLTDINATMKPSTANSSLREKLSIADTTLDGGEYSNAITYRLYFDCGY